MTPVPGPLRLRLKLWLTATACLGLWASPRSSLAVLYVDVTSSAGINHTQAKVTQLGPYRMTGGATAGDFDNDGWVDLFVTRIDDTDILYRNLGNGTFQDVSASAGFTSNLPTNGAAFADIDNDGDQDLYLTTVQDGRFYLYINDGAGGFTEQAVSRGAQVQVASGTKGQSVAMGDYDRDGYLDILTGAWGQPASNNASRLLRNLGAAAPGSYEDVTAASGLDQFPTSTSFRFSPRFADMDNDGRPDVVIAADFGNSQLFWNNGDGTFTDGTVPAGVGTDNNGMGSTVADFDADGDLDWFVTAVWAGGQGDFDGGNRLYVNNGDRTFTDGTDAAGVRDAGWGWGTSFLDYDNDGDLDLIATNGWEEFVINDPTTLWQNNNGVFTDVSVATGITDTDMGRGLLTLDYDNDGDLDVLVVNNASQPILYRNDGGNGNNWLRVKTQGTISNRDGIGARITVDPDSSITGDEMTREIDGGSNFLAQSEKVGHFGLGTNGNTIDRVTIRWPSGITQQFFNVSPNTELLAIEQEITGDLNGDGFVGIDDLNLVLGNWNQNTTAGMRAFGDPSGDGFVGIDDLNTVLGNWNTGTPPSSAAIPEPGTLALLGLGAVAMLRRGKKIS
jgi:enediyne biosynthesis protein E4